MVDEVLGGVNAFGVFAGEAEAVRALRSAGVEDGRGVHGVKIGEGEVASVADFYVAEVGDVGQRQGLGELLAKAELHFVFERIDAVFGETAGLDVAVEEHGAMAGERDFASGKDAGRAGSNDKDSFHAGTPRERMKARG